MGKPQKSPDIKLIATSSSGFFHKIRTNPNLTPAIRSPPSPSSGLHDFQVYSLICDVIDTKLTQTMSKMSIYQQIKIDSFTKLIFFNKKMVIFRLVSLSTVRF